MNHRTALAYPRIYAQRMLTVTFDGQPPGTTTIDVGHTEAAMAFGNPYNPANFVLVGPARISGYPQDGTGYI